MAGNKLNTKDKIVNKAVMLFNKKGFAAVSLFEIAGELNITRGNLTYHFKNKDVLLETIVNELWKALNEGRAKSMQFPSFENLHNEAQRYYKIQKEYAFIFLDYHVLNHKIVKQQFRAFTRQQIEDSEATFALAISRGTMHKEPYEGMYHNLAFNIWMVSFYWLNQQMILGKKSDKDYNEGEMKMWSMLLPHFTDKGLKGFREFFGDDYLKKLGKSFNADINNYVGF